MFYNCLMMRKYFNDDAVRLIRFSALLWLGYVIALGIISQSFGDPRAEDSEALYYILLGVVALICLALSCWKWIQERLGRAFIPLIITIITVLPIIITWINFKFFPHGPNFSSESMVLKLLPFLLVGFLLVAWRYRWPYFLLIILCITGLNIAIIWSFPSQSMLPGGHPEVPFFRGALTVPLIQTAVFLAVGIAISYLMSRLRRQQKSLEDANIRLTEYANTQEQLTISRERNRLARELHDTLAHTLSGLSLQLETIKAYWELDPRMAKESLDKSLETARSGLEETRRALKALRASPLEEMGLAQSIRVLAEDFAARHNLALDMAVPDRIPPLSPEAEQSIYRIVQEAITNTVNHASAKTLSIKIEVVEGKISLTIHDDGVGFDNEKSSKPSRFGLVGMRERAEHIGGKLNILSKPGAGTTIELKV